MGIAEAVREVPREGMANTPNPPLKAAQPVEGSLPAPRVPGGEGSGVTVCDLESESSPTEAVRMEEPSSQPQLASPLSQARPCGYQGSTPILEAPLPHSLHCGGERGQVPPCH